MAGDVMTITQRLMVACVGVLLGLGSAQAMQDPTEPPAEIRQPDPAGAVVPAGPVLQAILKSADRPAVAVISGQSLTLGEWVGAAKLIEIGADRVVLRGPDGKTTLRLLGGLQKQGVAKPGLEHKSRANRSQD